MAFYTGRTGELAFNGNSPIAKIRDWSIETTLELLSTNTVDSYYNTFTPGVVGATGSATLMYYKLEGAESSAYTEFTALLNKIMKTSSTGVTSSDRVQLYLNVGTAAADRIRCDAYITSASVSISAGELSVVPITFTVDGPFVELIS